MSTFVLNGEWALLGKINKSYWCISFHILKVQLWIIIAFYYSCFIGQFQYLMYNIYHQIMFWMIQQLLLIYFYILYCCTCWMILDYYNFHITALAGCSDSSYTLSLLQQLIQSCTKVYISSLMIFIHQATLAWANVSISLHSC